jgi:hypothetical protein
MANSCPRGRETFASGGSEASLEVPRRFLPPVEGMPVSEIRRVTVSGRREGRRTHAAYGSHARGIRVADGGDRVGRSPQPRGWVRAMRPEAWSAGIALALVFPLVGRWRFGLGRTERPGSLPAKIHDGGGSEGMKRKPSIKSLETVSLEEATAYLEHCGGDELGAAYALACDRNRLDGAIALPDDAEVHHALFLLCRARGKRASSFDEMRVELRRRIAA